MSPASGSVISEITARAVELAASGDTITKVLLSAQTDHVKCVQEMYVELINCIKCVKCVQEMYVELINCIKCMDINRDVMQYNFRQNIIYGHTRIHRRMHGRTPVLPNALLVKSAIMNAPDIRTDIFVREKFPNLVNL